jgi:hypothetical protein
MIESIGGIYCPYTVGKKFEATEPATAAAAGTRQREPRTAFQSSIFTVKSGCRCILTAAQPSEVTLFPLSC